MRRRRRPRPASVIFWLLILFNSCSTHATQVEYTETDPEEGSGYYYTAQDSQRSDSSGSGGCNFRYQIDYNEEFLINGFPPELLRKSVTHQYGIRPEWQRRFPFPHEQCIWEFHTREQDEDDCALEFHTLDFQRGDVRCEEQYLLIGDEYGDKRICGFGKPPKRFLSSGKKLFLGSYHRNGLHRTAGSSVSGVVRCVKRPRSNVLGYGYGHVKEKQGSGCQLSAPNCTFYPQSRFRKPNTGFMFVTFFAPPESQPSPNRTKVGPIDLEPECPNGADCDVWVGICFQTGPADCNITATVVNPMFNGSGVTGVECFNSTAACGAPGDCEAFGFCAHFDGSGSFIRIAQHQRTTSASLVSFLVLNQISSYDFTSSVIFVFIIH